MHEVAVFHSPDAEVTNKVIAPSLSTSLVGFRPMQNTTISYHHLSNTKQHLLHTISTQEEIEYYNRQGVFTTCLCGGVTLYDSFRSAGLWGLRLKRTDIL